MKISLTEQTRDRLASLGGKDDKFGEIILRLIAVYEAAKVRSLTEGTDSFEEANAGFFAKMKLESLLQDAKEDD